MTEQRPAVDAVVSAYRPDATLTANVIAIASQVRHVIVVDDGSGHDWDDVFAAVEAAGARVLRSVENEGIAHALNRGIEVALSEGADHVVTLDQDSEVPTEFVSSLLAALAGARSGGVDVGFVVPQRFAGVTQSRSRPRRGVLIARGAIQSGMLVPRSTFENVGLLRRDLFIDLVDTEYELRVSAHGLVPVAAPEVELGHTLGAAFVRPGLLGRLRLPVFPQVITLSSPFRYYYRARNRRVVHKMYAARFPLRMWRDLIVDRMHFADAARLASPKAPFKAILRRAAEDARQLRLGRAPEDVLESASGVTWNAARAR